MAGRRPVPRGSLSAFLPFLPRPPTSAQILRGSRCAPREAANGASPGAAGSPGCPGSRGAEERPCWVGRAAACLLSAATFHLASPLHADIFLRPVPEEAGWRPHSTQWGWGGAPSFTKVASSLGLRPRDGAPSLQWGVTSWVHPRSSSAPGFPLPCLTSAPHRGPQARSPLTPGPGEDRPAAPCPPDPKVPFSRILGVL